MTLEVRRIGAGEGPQLRDIRLRALRDAPAAFASTYDEEAARPAEAWSAAAAGRSTGAGDATFVAVLDGLWVGLVGGYRDTRWPGAVQLVSMWTAPEVRRAGVGRALVEAVVAWAEDTGADRVDLWVTAGNEPAYRLYESLGFRTTADVQPLPSDPCQNEVRMTRPF